MFLKAFVVILVAYGIAVAETSGKQGELVAIGEVDGKRYYAGIEEISWFAAADVCRRSNYKLASVESTEEISFLKAALSDRYNSTDISHYWTSGRDRNTNEQYIWDTTGQELGNIGLIDHFGPLSCLTFRVPDDPGQTLWDVRYCNEVWPALCHT